MASETMRVLLVEDSQPEARIIREALADVEGADLDLTHESDLAAGMKRASEEAFSVVLLDLTLPDSSGLETVTTFLAQSPDVPVVVLTGLYDEELGVKAVRAGAQDYLVKSETTGEEIWRALEFAIERFRPKKEP